jgi:hypothetical protein
MPIVNSVDMLCEITTAMQNTEKVNMRKYFIELPREMRIEILTNLLTLELLNDGHDLCIQKPHFPISYEVKMYDHITDEIAVDNTLANMRIVVNAHPVLTKMAEEQNRQLPEE